jgi:hypothetical protein
MKTLNRWVVQTLIYLTFLAMFAVTACGTVANSSLAGAAGAAPSDSGSAVTTYSQSDSGSTSTSDSQSDAGVASDPASPPDMAQSPMSILNAAIAFLSALPLIAIVALFTVAVFAIAGLSSLTFFWLKTRRKSAGAGG